MKFQQKFHLCITSFNIDWFDILNCHLSPLTIDLSALSSLVEDQAARKDCLTSKQSNKQLQNQLKKQTHKKTQFHNIIHKSVLTAKKQYQVVDETCKT